MKLCKRCNRAPAQEVFRAPCGCDNAYCTTCASMGDFQRWLKSYSQLHARVGGRFCDARGPLPCPTGVELQADFEETS